MRGGLPTVSPLNTDRSVFARFVPRTLNNETSPDHPQPVDSAGGSYRRISKHVRGAIYTRVSIGKQDTENQAERLPEFAAKQGRKLTHDLSDLVTGTESERDQAQFNRVRPGLAPGVRHRALVGAGPLLEGVLSTLHYLQRLDSSASRGARSRHLPLDFH